MALDVLSSLLLKHLRKKKAYSWHCFLFIVKCKDLNLAEDCGQETWTERLKQIEIIPDKPYLGWLEMRVIKTTFVMDVVLKTSYSLRKDLHS